MVEFRLLGAVEVWSGPVRRDAGLPQQRTVLAALLVDVGHVVSTDTLIQRVWGGVERPAVRGSLHSHIARVRRMLRDAGPGGDEPVRLTHRSGGYVVEADPELVDLHRFRRLCDRARAADRDPDRRAALLRQAVGLWRGEPLAGLTGDWVARMRDSWSQERVEAVVAWGGAEIELGNAGAILGTLMDLSSQYPLVESLVAVLMRALAMAGQPSDAIEQYLRIRDRLTDELGTDPGGELQALYRAILRGDVNPPREPAAPARPGAAWRPRPAQLPGDVFGFAGRDEQLAQLDELLAGAGQPGSTAAMISVVSGMAGVGKTALTVHWAHQVARRFPDGQLYVNLRGFDRTGAAMSPEEAVRGLLDVLGVPPAQIPLGLDGQMGLYRSLLAGRRMLLVLDNARDADQVRPLLPGSPTVVTIVTSRDRLTSLVATDGARPLALDLLTSGEARQLVTRRLGADRVAAERDAVEEIIAGCAKLPLALVIAAARAQQSGFPLAAVAGELQKAHRRLAALDGGDAMAEVRTVFSWSYTTLTPPAARVFRLLGLHPGPDISRQAVASLAGWPAARVRPVLTELVRASLVTEHVPGRYALHDLLRVYAASLADDVDADDVREAALIRVLDHYAHSAHAADRLLFPHRDAHSLPLDPPAPDAAVAGFADQTASMAWFAAERPALLAALRLAVRAGLDAHAWHLAWAVDTFLDRQGYRHDFTAAWQTALPAARRLGPRAVRTAMRRLAAAATRRGDFAEAQSLLQDVLDGYTGDGDQIGQARVHNHLAIVMEAQGNTARALDHAQQALARYRAAGHRPGEAGALNTVGWYHSALGDHPAAIACCQRAIELQQQLGDRHGEAFCWDSLGCAHHRAGDHARAVECFHRALDLCRDWGERYYEADTLVHLGDAYQGAGDPNAARSAWRQALKILEDLDHADADGVRTRLDATAG